MSANDMFKKKLISMSLRKRVAILALSLCTIVFLAEHWVIEPMLVELRRISQLSDALSNEKISLEAQIEKANSGGEIKRLQALLLSRQHEDEEIIAPLLRDAKSRLLEPARVADFLRELVPPTGSLRMISIKNSPAVKDERAARLFRHTFDVEFDGSYADIIEYMARIENSKWRISIGPMILKGLEADGQQTQKVMMSLQISVFSDSAAWLSTSAKKDGA